MSEALNILIGIVALILAAPVAFHAGVSIHDRFFATREGKPIATQAPMPGRWSLIFFNLIGAGLLAAVILRTWVAPPPSALPSGFNTRWPDAIQCDNQLPDQTSNRKSPLIYTFNGMRFSRRNIGDVAGYSIAGSYNKDGKYSPHEIWFSVASRKMIMPEEIRAAGSLDEVEKYYVDWFPYPDCGGNNIDAIVKAGRAYSFAQKMQ
jgi:hypothetical protein